MVNSKPGGEAGSVRNGPPHDGNAGPSACFILCRREEPNFEVHPNQAVEEVLGESYCIESAKFKGTNILVCRDDRLVGALSHVPAPMDPEEDLIEAASANPKWPDGREQVAKHRSLVIAAVNGEDDLSPVDCAILLTRLAVAGLQIFDGFGVFWPYADLCNPREYFEKVATKISDGQLAIPLWIRCDLVRAPDGTLAASTRGMHQFGFAEFEVDRCSLDPQRVMKFLWSLAQAVIVRGVVAGPARVVARCMGLRVRVMRGRSRRAPDQMVYKLALR